MSRLIAVVVTLSVFFTWSSVWAQLSPSQEKRLKELEEKERIWKTWEATRSEQEKQLRDISGNGSTDSPVITPKKLDDERNFISEKRAGRFQAIRMDSNAVFIIDSIKGHLWVWVIQKDSSGQPSEFLFYQGQVIPGLNMGDLVDRTYKKIPGNPPPSQ